MSGLLISDLNAYYGKSHILQGVSLYVGDGQAVALLGRNGAGKTTTLKSIMGLVAQRSGQLEFAHRNLLALQPFEIARLGLAYVPETRIIFSALSVEENLRIACRGKGRWDVAAVFRAFPQLEERRGNWGHELSGGEQQMLAIGRALVSNPRALLLDEPAQGLAPVILKELQSLLKLLSDSGVTILLVEQNVEFCTGIASDFCVMDSGRLVYSASRAAFLEADAIRSRYLTVDA